MFEAAPLGANCKYLLLLHPDCIIDGVVDTSGFHGIVERNSDDSSGDKIIGFEFDEMG